MINLVCVESQGKVASITKYLNENPALKKYGKFIVLATFGHIRDLAKKKLAIDVDNNFEAQYEYLAEKASAMEKIKKAAASADVVYLASDFDVEGSAIAEGVRVFLNLGENYKRIVFTEITPPALQYAIEHPGKIDRLQLAGQQCRRILDRLVGFKLSPLLWKKFTSGSITLSAGRVQSAVMHLIIQREKDIEAFESSPYWHINADFSLGIEDAKLYDTTGVYKTENADDIKAFFKSINNSWAIEKQTQKTVQQNPDAPFITSTLQQEASSKLKISVKRVMAIAQELYEAGHITYMRTDSYNMSEVFKESAKKYILQAYGAEYVSTKQKNIKKSKGAQEAHECIRPTRIDVSEIQGTGRDLYRMIWQRSIAYLMSPAVFDELTLQIRDSGMRTGLFFKVIFKKVKFNGYLIVYGIKNESGDFSKYSTTLKITCSQIRAKNTWTSPPSRYNDASLIKLMESNGIGRPSTFSSVLEKLYDKTYVIKTDIQGEEKNTVDYSFSLPDKKITKMKGTVAVGAEKGKAKPTDIGVQIDKYLEAHFSYIVNKDFTAHMEADLDLISEGKKKRNDVLSEFWKQFSRDLESQVVVKGEKKKVIEAEKLTFDIAGKTYTVRMGPYGPLVEYEQDGKKTYIGLKGYLLLVRKEYTDIDADDIAFLLEMPKKMGKVNGFEVVMLIGPYGPYLKWNDTNIKIPKFALKNFDGNFSIDQLKSFIEFSKKTSADRGSSATLPGRKPS